MNILFRVDASIQIGSGHVMRCLALAERLRDQYANVKFISRLHKGNLNNFIMERGFDLIKLEKPSNKIDIEELMKPDIQQYNKWLGVSEEQDAQDTINCIIDKKINWLIVDHYALGEKWGMQLRPFVKNIMVIDDLANRKYECDLLLDQNWFNKYENRYYELVPETCIKLLGPKYALLRPEFAAVKTPLNPKTGKIKRIFVFFGGSDPHNITEKTLHALCQPELLFLEADIVIGENNSHQNVIKKLVENRHSTRLHIQIDNIASVMANADLAVCSEGVNTWERMALGIPSISVITAENQKIMSEELNKNQLTYLIGEYSNVNADLIAESLYKMIIDQNKITEQRNRIKNIVNVHGCEFVTDWLIGTLSYGEWKVKQAKKEDMNLYWLWANDKDVRNNALNKELISWSTHKKWFTEKINNKNSVLYKIEVDNKPIGQVRFDIEKNFARIDYSIGKQFRDRKLGWKLLKIALNEFHNNYPNTVAGEVIPENIASAKIFESLGFKKSIVGNNYFFTKKPKNVILSNA